MQLCSKEYARSDYHCTLRDQYVCMKLNINKYKTTCLPVVVVQEWRITGQVIKVECGRVMRPCWRRWLLLHTGLSQLHKIAQGSDRKRFTFHNAQFLLCYFNPIFTVVTASAKRLWQMTKIKYTLMRWIVYSQLFATTRDFYIFL